MKALTPENPMLKKLAPRFITDEKGKKEEIVFNFWKFRELWEEIEDALVDEEYELQQDAKTVSAVLERARSFDESKAIPMEEMEKKVGL
jgi:hypothetical protein